jgi:hypothetical protein
VEVAKDREEARNASRAAGGGLGQLVARVLHEGMP